MNDDVEPSMMSIVSASMKRVRPSPMLRGVTAVKMDSFVFSKVMNEASLGVDALQCPRQANRASSRLLLESPGAHSEAIVTASIPLMVTIQEPAYRTLRREMPAKSCQEPTESAASEVNVRMAFANAHSWQEVAVPWTLIASQTNVIRGFVLRNVTPMVAIHDSGLLIS